VDPNLRSDCALKASCPGFEETECDGSDAMETCDDQDTNAIDTDGPTNPDPGVESSSSSSSTSFSPTVNAIEANGAMSRMFDPQFRCCRGCGKDVSDSRYRCYVSGKNDQIVSR